MSDIFVSYGNADRAVAQQMASALEALGWSVWWDREIPFGKSFDQVIEDELNAARCVVVLWSKDSVRSRWVKTEAAAAADRDCLIPVVIDDVPLPFEFKRIESAVLRGWNGERTHPEFLQLVDSIGEMLGQTAIAQTWTAQQRARVPPRPSKRTTRIALGGAALVLVLIAWLFARSRFRATEDNASQRPNDSHGISSQSGQPVDSSTSSGSGSNRPVAAGGAPTSVANVPAVANGAFAIKIGDRIDDGIPGLGAGNIESPDTKDVYTFRAAAGQRVYFRILKHGKDMDWLDWTLVDPDGSHVFDSHLFAEPGVQLLKRSGTYAMTVGSDSVPATGTYALQLLSVPPPDQLGIKIGDRIDDGVPGPGAGNIESPGAKDVYTFSAAGGQRVYFRMLKHDKDLDWLNWTLVDPDGTQIFDSHFFAEPGVQPLKRSGTYTLTVGSDNVPATGTYALQLFNVPPPAQFGIKIGDTIKENMPGPGAGNIESPGAKDVYTFSAAGGQRVSFRMLKHDKDMDWLNWTLVDPDGTQIFDSRFFAEPGVQLLKRPGTYTLTVGSDQVPATGTYWLQLSNAPSGR